MAAMEFKAVMKDAKVSAEKVVINVLGGDGLSVDELRTYFGEPVIIRIELVQPPLPVEASDGYVAWVDENGEVVG